MTVSLRLSELEGRARAGMESWIYKKKKLRCSFDDMG